MKKFLALLTTLLMLTACACAEESVSVYVSITDGEGNLALAHEAIVVTDTDADGMLTIADALACAHIEKHENGAEAFATAQTEYGLSMVKLWNVDNGGSYGYYLNNASAWSLLDPVSEGDHVKAYAYTDLTAWSDVYCFFSSDEISAPAGSDIALQLSAAAFDENFAPITIAVADAVITVNGEATETKTDAEGNAVLTLTEKGVYVISASSETLTLVAPVCIVTAE